jgi:ribonucleoside-diphosphate reductase alpha chain
VRGIGSHIHGTNGQSQGVIPFLKVANDSAIAVNQGGKRKGAVCAYLSTWHIDIEEFLELRKNTGDDRRRTHDMNTANWIPDLFMKRVEQRAKWTLFSPNECPDLHDLFGLDFEKAYLAYEAKAARGEIKNFKTIEATDLWRKMLTMLFETGHPWITFKDPSNLRSPQRHAGVVHSSNLCTEILLNTSEDEIAVCNLGSINLVAHVIPGQGLDLDKLKATTFTAMRMLDNVIDQNLYPVEMAKNSNLKHRPVGLGLMGFQDALYALRLPYASDGAMKFADESMEAISYFAILASTELAKERGAYSSYKGSLWDQGILPIDSIKFVDEARGELVQMDRSMKMDWSIVREAIKQNGMRNSNCMAIAPTATISNIVGVAQSIEPTYKNLFVKSNMSGEFTVINPYLYEDLKAAGLWDEAMISDLKKYDGELEPLSRVPAEIKALYRTSFDVEPKWLIEAASRRQKWIDMGQSLNLYMAQPSGKKLDEMYRLAWKKGLKTTYYLRSLGATTVEKSTINTREHNHVAPLSPVKAEARSYQPAFKEGAKAEAAPAQAASATDVKFCSITDPTCEACQ